MLENKGVCAFLRFSAIYKHQNVINLSVTFNWCANYVDMYSHEHAEVHGYF